MKALSDDWRPSDSTIAIIAINWPDMVKDLEDRIVEFRLYQQSMGALKADWDKGFQFWLTRARIFNAPKKTRSDKITKVSEFKELAEKQKQGGDVWS